MTTLIECILTSVWKALSEVGKTYDTPDLQNGSQFIVCDADINSITIKTTGGAHISIDRAQFHEALKYLIENGHLGAGDPCKIEASRSKPGHLNRATSSLRSGTVVISYILPMLASTEIVGIDGKRPNTTWINL